jgi:hypothetical protein
MATEGVLTSIPGLKASADLSAKQYRFVKMSGNSQVDVCAAITDKVVGVLQDNPVSGLPANVADEGRSKVLLGGTVAYGDMVGTDNQGRAVTIVAGTDTTQYVCGRCVFGGAVGEIGSIQVNLSGRAS